MGLFGAISAALATGFLGVVVFGVPYIKQIFFLRASFGEGDFNGSVILGTLGFCLEFFNATSNGTELACSQPSIIYQPGQFPTFHFIPLGNKPHFLLMKDINNLSLTNLTGDITLPDKIPQIVNKWIITALVLHVAASITAVISIIALSFSTPRPIFGIIVAEFAAIVTLVAFALDIILFIVSKKFNSAAVNSSRFGFAVWFTLAAFVLLLISGFVDRPKKNVDADGG